ncbi:hypothetical protein [Streptomyces sp. SID4982]|uniref:hypothetical protein n=1 Tax=Streptomyces sp. SID4982 TaxID=2690291 RepID=UPI00136816FA|nr:hypothetical protein [Streptomyces sp. SID4982]MYS15798.1 hypothetical protein [Streptomyces sp. SID4982]
MAGITGLDRSRAFVLPLKDSDAILAAVRRALAEAAEEERPGLERAVALVESTAAASEDELCARWVRARLADVGFTGDVASLSALKALRKAERSLGLLTAVELQKKAVAHPE